MRFMHNFKLNRRLGGSVAESLWFCVTRPFLVAYAGAHLRWKRHRNLQHPEWDSIYGLNCGRRR
jgi:hypothetical protein